MTTNDLRTALARVRAFLFDLDGVLTPTAEIHRRAWAALFEAEFAARGVAPYRESDYYEHLDGKARLDGVRDLLASRGITLPEGHASDGPSLETLWGLGNRKNAAFSGIIERDGIEAYPGSLAFLDAIEAAGYASAVVTSSRNGEAVLRAAGLRERFSRLVDGQLAAGIGLAGKPAADTYLHAAQLLGQEASACAVIEDAVSGVQAGRAGGFGLVVGVDRGQGKHALHQAGADLVVSDLAELLPAFPGRPGAPDEARADDARVDDEGGSRA